MISVNITYYNEHHLLNWWYATFKSLYEQGYDIELNIADDGSAFHLGQTAKMFFEQNTPMPNMRLFYIPKDIGFNSHGARNLLMKQTRTEWNMFSDIDRRYSLDVLKNVISREEDNLLEKGKHYFFLNEKDKQSSVSDFVVSKTDFWKTGGYDEEFVNIHWGDRLFLDCLSYVSKKVTFDSWRVKSVRGARKVSYSSNVAITTYPDNNTLIHPINDWAIPEKRQELKKMVSERNKTHKGRMSKKVINFEWEQVF